MLERLNKILRYPEIIPCDKRLHFLVGAVVASVMVLFIKPIVVFILGLFISFGIEYYQKLTKSGKFDRYDALATIAGFIVVITPLLAIIPR